MNNTFQIAVFYTDTCACCRVSLHILNVLLTNTFPTAHSSTLKTAHISQQPTLLPSKLHPFPNSPLFYPQNCTRFRQPTLLPSKLHTFPTVHSSTLKTAHVSDSPLFYPQNCTSNELNTFQKSSLSSFYTDTRAQC